MRRTSGDSSIAGGPLLRACRLLRRRKRRKPSRWCPVQVTAVRQDSIRRIITADAVLFPRDQASVMPKISAPVRKFYVNRGDHVKQGQLLAVLENRDLAAAAAESKGQFEQAEANYRTTSGASVPEEVNKAQAEVRAAQQTLDAARSCWRAAKSCSRKARWRANSWMRRRSRYAQARSQYETAQEHLTQLPERRPTGADQRRGGPGGGAQGAIPGRRSAARLFRRSAVRSAASLRTGPLYAGEMANAGSPLLTVMDVSRVIARANVPQNQAAYLKVGAAATINRDRQHGGSTGQGDRSQPGGRSEQHHRAGLGSKPRIPGSG